MAKTVVIPADETERILGPEDERGGEEEYAGFFVSVGSAADVRLVESLRNKKTGARDGITIPSGTQFFIDKEKGAHLHMFADGAQVEVEVQGFVSRFGDLE